MDASENSSGSFEPELFSCAAAALHLKPLIFQNKPSRCKCGKVRGLLL